jgi:hypothetical protein
MVYCCFVYLNSLHRAFRLTQSAARNVNSPSPTAAYCRGLFCEIQDSVLSWARIHIHALSDTKGSPKR